MKKNKGLFSLSRSLTRSDALCHVLCHGLCHGLCHALLCNKTFSGFFCCEFPSVNWKYQIPLSDHNKIERIKMDPIGLCIAESLRGIKRFQDFNKISHPPVNLKLPTPLSRHNKMKRIKMDPLGFALQSPFGG